MGDKLSVHTDTETLADIFETLNVEENVEGLYDEQTKYIFFWFINKEKASLSGLAGVRDWSDSIKDFKVRGLPMTRWIEIGELLAKHDLERAAVRPGNSGGPKAP